ncbi:MAG TPA: hypothetical protein VMI75_36460 [Polyangiaceae bacterium]|nr:hypothetical protein [Polyangiaceae bacterium]
MTSSKLVSHLLAAMLGAVAVACSVPSSGARFDEQTPDSAGFPPVASMLVQACGTLDCHGTIGRNLRLYGDTGLRYSPTDVPSTLVPTTADEVTQDYESVVGLEPEITSEVVAAGGANPERLTFYRKALGLENHKGGAVVVHGDPRDVCITTWLQGHADASACTAALTLP